MSKVSTGYKINGEDILGWNVSEISITYRVLAADELQITANEEVSSDWLAEDATVILTEEGEGWSETLFAGRVVERSYDFVEEVMTYRAVNAWADLQRVVYETSSSGSASGFARTHTILGRSSTGLKRRTGQEIISALEWAKAQLPGTFDYTIADDFPSEYPPPDEVVDITCAEVVEKMLRFIPEAVTRWDYSQTPPHLYIETVDTAPAEVINLSEESVNQCQLARRSDQDINGVRVYIERAHLVNGSIDDTTVSAQSVGESSGIGILRHTVELEGAQEEREFNTIQAQRWRSYDALEIFEQVWPEWFNSEDYNYTNLDVDLDTYGTKAYVLTGGEYKDWMAEFSNGDVDFGLIGVEISYTQSRKSGGTAENIVRRTSLPMIGPSFRVDDGENVFSRLLASVAQESIGNIASRIFEAQQVLGHSGYIELNMDRNISPLVADVSGQIPLAGSVLDILKQCGRRLNVSGGRTEWQVMNALISEVRVSLGSGIVGYTVGPAGLLSAGDIISLCRAARQRKKPSRLNELD